MPPLAGTTFGTLTFILEHCRNPRYKTQTDTGACSDATPFKYTIFLFGVVLSIYRISFVLLKARKDPQMAQKSEVTLEQVFAWARKGDLESLRTLAPVELLSKADAAGQRVMHVAAAHGQTAVLEWLVEDESRDAMVNRPDEDARGPLHLAAWHGHAETVRALLEMGAIRDRPTRTGFTPLHYVSLFDKRNR